MSSAWLVIRLDPDDREFARLRADEIGIGHEDELLVALQDRPLIAARAEIEDELRCYMLLDPEHELPDEGRDFGLIWEAADSISLDEMLSLEWCDWDERSVWLANELSSGAQPIGVAERLLALAWLEYGARKEAWRPRMGLREPPLRAVLRAYYDELEYDLIAARRDEVDSTWWRLHDERSLDDGSLAVVEREMSDGGYFVGSYVVSRYANPARRDTLIERYHLADRPPELRDPNEPYRLGIRPNVAQQVWLDYLLESGDPQQRAFALATVEHLNAP